ncbi:UDP-N-acetylglucosamine:LPS N-acetylglucosamine transferase [Natronospira proteinivora]|uniref:UDP-N-acetylglucosamine:LPS N-acetylglucosamine transferase n=1 Tax=Natronospira proteinivora TaxID=1807133 RepID=A0ABT1GBN9_9GAMM|nr:DUF4168 domain-containing protein [Natronospira proteinivora]MCP1728350.1 UDP-N-acetylglucosamine:LPS N-acetylglucosamine transferase [Natronospira proteinivora]
MTIRKTLSIAIGASFLASPLVIAQPQQEQPQQQPQEQEAQPMEQQQEAQDISDEQIEQFVEAYAEAKEAREEYTERAREADEPQEAQQLRQRANEAETEAIRDAGMDVDEYRDVEIAMQTDPDIREEVHERLEDKGVEVATRR